MVIDRDRDSPIRRLLVLAVPATLELDRVAIRNELDQVRHGQLVEIAVQGQELPDTFAFHLALTLLQHNAVPQQLRFLNQQHVAVAVNDSQLQL
jgi:hypothetical protein